MRIIGLNKTYQTRFLGVLLMLGLLYHHATLLVLILIVTYSAPIFTNAILKNMKNNMKVYISGKIGEEVISDATRQKFARAEEMLKAKGYAVINPASEMCQRMLRFSMAREELHGHGDAWKGDFYSFALMTDLVSIWRECDAIYMLEDWEKSPGANAELNFAMATGKKVLWQRLEDAQLNHGDDEAAEDVWLPIEEEEAGV